MSKRLCKSGAEKRRRRKLNNDLHEEFVSKVPRLSTFFTIASSTTEVHVHQTEEGESNYMHNTLTMGGRLVGWVTLGSLEGSHSQSWSQSCAAKLECSMSCRFCQGCLAFLFL